MYSRINYTLVGLFVLIMGIGMLLFGFWLAKYGFEQKYQYYVMYFDEPVDGLTIDSSVKLNGVDVGKVVTIEVSPKNYSITRVKVKLKEGTPITKGMYATLKPQGITGLSFIEITGDKNSNEKIKISSKSLPQIPTKHSILYTLQKKAPDMIDKLSKAMDRVDILLSDENIKKVNHILSNTESITDSALNLEDTIKYSLSDINKSIAIAGNSFSQMSNDFVETANIVNKNLPHIMKKINILTVRLNRVTNKVNLALSRGDLNFDKIIKPIRIDIDELSYKYQELAQDLKNITMNPVKAIFNGANIPAGPGEK